MDLFSTLRLGRLELPNRIVMAPMTRSRAIGSVPNDLMRTYYMARASAGLIITEGVAPSPNALGYARIPGLFSSEQIGGWRRVTSAVHEAGGRIFAQLMHTGRIAHPLNQPEGALVLAPSAVAAKGSMYTDARGPQPMPEPLAMSAAEMTSTRREFVTAATNAIEAGFDGVELHAANGYLLEQFLHPHTNRRTDVYGGSVENRTRFLSEVSREVAEQIGGDRLGVRLSPFNTFNDLPLHDAVQEQYDDVARALREVAYLHVVDSAHPGYPVVLSALREHFVGPIIRNGGYDAARANQTLREGAADAISFGRPFIANPDLVERLRHGQEPAKPDPATFYTPGPEGYVD